MLSNWMRPIDRFLNKPDILLREKVIAEHSVTDSWLVWPQPAPMSTCNKLECCDVEQRKDDPQIQRQRNNSQNSIQHHEIDQKLHGLSKHTVSWGRCYDIEFSKTNRRNARSSLKNWMNKSALIRTCDSSYSADSRRGPCRGRKEKSYIYVLEGMKKDQLGAIAWGCVSVHDSRPIAQNVISFLCQRMTGNKIWLSKAKSWGQHHIDIEACMSRIKAYGCM